MPLFEFEAMDREGNEIRDRLAGSSESDVHEQVKRRGYFVTRISCVPGSEDVMPPTQNTSELDAALLPLLRAGKKIEAVKRYKEATGAGLREAKAYVEGLAQQHGVPSTEGCTVRVGILLLLL